MNRLRLALAVAREAVDLALTAADVALLAADALWCAAAGCDGRWRQGASEWRNACRRCGRELGRWRPDEVDVGQARLEDEAFEDAARLNEARGAGR